MSAAPIRLRVRVRRSGSVAQWAVLAASVGACAPDGFRYEVDDPAPDERAALPAPVTLMLGGDVMVGRGFNHMARRTDELDLWSALEPRLARADVVALNFEGTVTAETERWPNKAYHFRLEPQYADEVLGGLGPASDRAVYFSLANNHSLDFGRAGARDTRAQLAQLGFRFAGTAATRATASVADVVETPAGVRVGSLSATDHCGCDDLDEWAARGDREGPWVLRLGRADQRQAAVDEAVRVVARWREEVDVLVFSLHWGSNWVDPDDEQLAWMRGVADALIRAGVDVVHGHGAHHPLAVQSLRGATVVYGPGDLIDDYSDYEGYRNDLSYLVEIEIDPHRRQQHRVWPTRIARRDDGTRWVEPLDEADPDHAFVLDAAEPSAWRALADDR
jgi:poly-gamma-glutamate synthesis protein (capsule biosynthesis protein)